MKWISGLFALLLVGCSGSQIAAEPQVITQIVVVTATPEQATPLPSGGKWVVNQDISDFDDTAQVVLVLLAEEDVAGAFRKTRPSLALRCKEKRADVIVNVDQQIDKDGLSDFVSVRVRFDKKKAETHYPGLSTDSKAVFFDPVKPFIKEMLAADQMLFQFTPFSASPATATFDIRGLSEVIGPFQEACPKY